MIVKLQNFFIRTDQILYITEIYNNYDCICFKIKFLGNVFDVIYQWNTSNYVESKEILIKKMDLVRNELVRLANNTTEIIEIGQTINLKRKIMSNWINLPNGSSVDLNCVWRISPVEIHDTYIIIKLYSSYKNNCYQEIVFDFDDYIENKDELINKVKILRDNLIKKANLDKDVINLVNIIDIKKKKT